MRPSHPVYPGVLRTQGRADPVAVGASGESYEEYLTLRLSGMYWLW